MKPVALFLFVLVATIASAEESALSERNTGEPSNFPAPERFGWFKRVAKDWRNRLDRAKQSQSLRDKLHVSATPSDVLLVSRCRSLFAADPTLNALNIHVTCSQGVIMLSGDVPTESTRMHVHRLASNTVGVQAVQNNLQVHLGGTVQAHYVGASLLPPVRLASPARSESPAFGSPTGMPSKSAVVLGPPVSISSRPGLPDVHSYMIQQSPPRTSDPLAMTSGFPVPWSQTVAKNPLQPSTLPSGYRLGNSRSIIPAPGSNWAEVSSSPRISAAANAATGESRGPVRIPSSDFSTREASMVKDIASMLELDPRAQAIRFTAKGSEIVLVGSIGSPEDLYELARRINDVPGVEFVSFSEVSFGH